MGIRMSRTWLARGTSAGVLTFVVGAWAVGLALGTEDDAAKDRESVPAAPETSTTPSEEPSVMGEREDRPRKQGDKPSDSPTAVVPVADSADEVDPSTDEPDDDPHTPKPSPKPSNSPKPRPTDGPTKTPSPSPSPTDPDCQRLNEVLDCVLAPITTKP